MVWPVVSEKQSTWDYRLSRKNQRCPMPMSTVPGNSMKRSSISCLGCRKELNFGKHKFRFKNKLFSLDATVIDLCASLFDWAKFRQTKGAVKLHLLLDHDGYLPVFAHITDGKVHEVKIARAMLFPAGSILAIDKGYIDFELFWHWTGQGVFLVTRQKHNARYRIVEDRGVPQNSNVLCDQIIELEVAASRDKYIRVD